MIDHRFSRRDLLRAVACAAGVGAARSAFAQGRCMRTFGIPACNTTAIAAVFAPTGWKTTSLEHMTFRVADYRKEAAFYIALMGWTLLSDDGNQAVLDIGDWGSAIFRQAPAEAFDSGGARGGRGAPVHAVVDSFCVGIEPWSAKTVERELKARGLTPIAETGPNGFESFHVKDLDGFDLQISNGAFAKRRKAAPAAAKLSEAAPFAPTGWKTVWLDHFSFGIQPWDTDGVKAELETRGLRAQIDTSTGDEIHVAAFKSYHTATPNGYNLQISYVTHDNRLALPNAVRPKPSAGKL